MRLPDQLRRGGRGVRSGLDGARLWFRDYRRTRPFWGGLWTMLGGAWIIHAMSFRIGLTLTPGWSSSAGYVMGGGLALFGLVAWLAPFYRGLAALVAFLIALAAFPTSNLGGYLLGTALGIVGSSMIWAWGEKTPRRPRRHGRSAGVAADAGMEAV
ncbi:MAG: DUF6114 domain-containing protein [Nocardioides sp.]|uniref:DUF6114 domain-containing protein n=1 Tax=Nocardioides sp. TaxID=35761 RepID=UPI0039E5DAB2